jgi:polyphosphate kinase 2 (PPK2 family)
MKHIGRGGPNQDFLQGVKPFTRTIRIFLAVARALEARDDNRLLEVGVAETLAFMGNRCFRYWARHLTDMATLYVAFPISAVYIAPYLDQKSRPVIVLMGLVRVTCFGMTILIEASMYFQIDTSNFLLSVKTRAILPFASSFQGSAFGRKLTFYTFRAFHYRWKPIQGIFHFHEKAGVYQDIDPDEKLILHARELSVAIGHGMDPSETRRNLKTLGFDVIGAGSGGHASFRKQSSLSTILLHMTPYGPSVLDEMPRYIILQRISTTVVASNNAIIKAAKNPVEAELQGFTYSGAFFTSQEWAALKSRFDEELLSYRIACQIMGTPRSHIDSTKLQHNEIAFPPTDLLTLKAFLRTGQPTRSRRKAERRWQEVLRKVNAMAKLVQNYQRSNKAPRGVILYMEGLDCSGKSSTGGLIMDALEQSGYKVDMKQHNLPPTEEQKKQAWMRRFETPFEVNPDAPYSALVWDRGPAGDFVYGHLDKLPTRERLEYYQDFCDFDQDCQAQNILFCKVLFVSDKDSIAATLGKRLAHKKIARDLRTWLDASSSHSQREGLDAIEAQIDPTDFIAFNKFNENLAKFCEFARNTETDALVGGKKSGHDNPWLVVSTGKRHPARLGLLNNFQKQLKNFSTQPIFKSVGADCDPEESPLRRLVPSNIVADREHGISKKAVFQTLLLICLVYAYAKQTWKFGFE